MQRRKGFAREASAKSLYTEAPYAFEKAHTLCVKGYRR